MNPETQLLLPAARSTYASSVDGLYYALVALSIVLFLIILGMAGYWVMKYRRKEGDEKKLSTPTIHSVLVELLWSVGPMIICLGLFHVGVKQYLDARVAPGDAMTVYVTGRKWAWQYKYANGKISDGKNAASDAEKKNGLHVPVGKPVRLVMNSQDVIHSFFLPEFRVKQDVLPGRYSTVWFQADKVGTSVVFCTEYCGMDHSDMLSEVVVQTEEEFQKWLDFDPYKGLPPVEAGKALYEAKACVGCHSLDGSLKAGGGPSFKGLFGKTETITGGTTVAVDEAYLRESILVPGAKVVNGFPNVMPAFQGQLKEEHVQGLIEFIKAQK